MDSKARLILRSSCRRDGVHGDAVVTYLNLGLRADFVVQWVKAYLIAWPVAAATGYLRHADGAAHHRAHRRR